MSLGARLQWPEGSPNPRRFSVLFHIAVFLLLGSCSRTQPLAPRTLPSPVSELECKGGSSARTLVIVTAGQSNAANHGEAATSPRNAALALHAGKCYAAHDPQPGASGSGGSPWPALADELIERGKTSRVLYVHCAITSTTVTMWNENPELVGCVRSAQEQLKVLGLAVNFVLWHQGEADARENTANEPFRHHFSSVLTKLKSATENAPILVAQTSVCRNNPNEIIRSAQAAMWNSANGVFPGPDTDSLGDRERFDGCHFSRSGLKKVAYMWAQALNSTGKLSGN